MSDQIGHYCGLAVVRLRKPPGWFRDHYDDPLWGLRRLYLLMEKQHNRGQDGAGLAVCKFNMPPGQEYLKRLRTFKRNPIERLFDTIFRDVRKIKPDQLAQLDDDDLKNRIGYLGEVMLGHLRYGTHSGHGLANCHPYVRRSNVASRNLALAGNFNMTNSAELFEKLMEYGLNPVGDSDTQVILERIGYSLDREHQWLEATMGPESLYGLDGVPLAREISKQINLARVLRKASYDWDGGYVFASLLGNGDACVCRDPAGIRPAFFYEDDEVIAMASERAALVTVFDADPEAVRPIDPAHALIIKRDGSVAHEPFTDALPKRQCSFERIYFSRGNDSEIYQQRKALGRKLAPRVHEAIGGSLDNCVFSFIPNTAEPAFLGLVEEIDKINSTQRAERLWRQIEAGRAKRQDLDSLAHAHPRIDKVAHKDQKLRTFITHDSARLNLVSHIYDITQGTVGPEDTLIVVDDSIVRGTTLRESIITMLSRLNPKRIIVVSSAPPIMYPDCYGIDMSQLGRFIAFEAAVSLLHERNETVLLDDIDQRCLEQSEKSPEKLKNHVRRIYEWFSLDELSAKISELVRPANCEWSGELNVIYQTIDGLQDAMGEYTGDWYFTGNYPTPGGYKVLNAAYLKWRRGDTRRSYESTPKSETLTGPATLPSPEAFVT